MEFTICSYFFNFDHVIENTIKLNEFIIPLPPGPSSIISIPFMEEYDVAHAAIETTIQSEVLNEYD